MKNRHRDRISMIVITALMTMASHVLAQRPIIKSLDRYQAANGDILTIRGSSFGTDANSIVVFFGSMEGSVNHISDELIEARVPTGTLFNSVSVTNTTSGLTGYSATPFMLTYSGEHGFGTSSLEGQKNFDAERGLYDLCLCDLDGDLKSDVMAASEESANAALMINKTMAAGIENIVFEKNTFLINARTIHVKCGDLNGDGKPDLVLTEAGDGDKIFFLKNNSSGPGDFQFSSTIVNLPEKKVKRIEIADIDEDGKPEVIITNQSGSTITVLINQSTLENVSFSNTNVVDINISIPLNRGFDGLAVSDLDGDGKPEIVSSQFQTAVSNLYIVPNNSTPGDLSFGPTRTFDLTGTAVAVKIADLDNDQKPDIAATLLLESSIAIFRNEGDLSFAPAQLIQTDVRPYGFDFGDLDGDGRPDIAIASILNKSITILNNASTPGNLSFDRTIKQTDFINRHVAIGDVDGDGKPDVSFTSVDNNNAGELASKISVLRNTRCILPNITPEGPHAICTGSSKTLNTATGAGLVYEWKNNGITITDENNAALEVTSDGIFTVTLTSSADEQCNHTSDAVTVSIETGTGLSGEATVLPVDPICAGNTLALVVEDVGATKYKWSGPEGYEAEGIVANPPIANFQAVNSGRYTVDVYAGDCVAQQASIVVGILEAPAFHLNVSGNVVVCESETKILTVSPQLESFQYQWYEETAGALPGQTTTSLTVTEPGAYYIRATTLPACASGETNPTKVTFAQKPTADFTAPATVCISQEVAFTDISTSEEGVDLFYVWNFGDNTQSTDQNPSHAYSSFNEFTVSLTVSYENGFCPDDVTKTIVVEQTPQVSIGTPSDEFTFCEGGSLMLSVQGDFDTFEWSTGETTPTIEVSEPGIYAVEARTLAGCAANGTQEVFNFSEPTVTASVVPEEITEGETAQLSATGLVEYQWSPIETLTGADTSSPNGSPVETTIYTVTGVDENGCGGMATVTLRVKGDLATNKIVPAKFFSPGNGDDINATWLIEKILAYPNCKVTIYDDKGVPVFEAKPYLNSWDGTFQGRQLPDGVYFYFIKCDGEENSPKTGTITLLR